MFIADTQNLRNEPAHDADQYAADNRLEWNGLSGKLQEPLAHAEQEFCEGHRYEATGDTEHGVDREFPRVDKLVLGHFKKRIVTQQEPQHAPGSGGRENDRTQHGSVKIADDF